MEGFRQNIMIPHPYNNHFPYAHHFLIFFFTSFTLDVELDLEAT